MATAGKYRTVLLPIIKIDGTCSTCTPDGDWIDGLPVWLIFAYEVSYQNLLKSTYHLWAIDASVGERRKRRTKRTKKKYIEQ